MNKLQELLGKLNDPTNPIHDLQTPTTDLYVDKLANIEKIGEYNNSYIKTKQPQKTPVIEEIEDNGGDDKMVDDNSDNGKSEQKKEDSEIGEIETIQNNEIKLPINEAINNKDNDINENKVIINEVKADSEKLKNSKISSESNTSSDELLEKTKEQFNQHQQSESLVTNTELRKTYKKSPVNKNDFHRQQASKYKKQAVDFEGFESQEALDEAKLRVITKMCQMAKKGVKFSKNYSMRDSYSSMNYECKLHTELKTKANGVSMLSNFILGGCQMVEFFNERYDPFGADLSGWTANVGDQINNGSMEDNLSDLYDIYMKDKKNMKPEFVLMFTLVSSAISFSVVKKIINNHKSSMSKVELQRKLQHQEQTEQFNKNAAELKKQKDEYNKKIDIMKLQQELDAETKDGSSLSKNTSQTINK